ncbi:MAG: glutathione S-transferase family protein [Pseudomonadota bacterium]|nr:glutathione S-transferase family protein [Pseudomonadota bacterium]
MKLYIGNKNYSSWSLRPWLLMKVSGIAFEEVNLRLSEDAASPFKQTLLAIAPSGKVPLLVDDSGFAIWDSLAICETLAERHPEKSLWPADAQQRARARSLCAEMHSGFGALRQAFPMNLEAELSAVGRRVLPTNAAAARDVARIDGLWSDALASSGGPFLFGAFGIADAFFAPVCVRFKTYGLPRSGAAAAFVERIDALPALREWTQAALAEHDFIADDEPYRSAA